MYVKVKSRGKFVIVEICDPECEDFTSNAIVISIANNLNLELEAKELLFKDRDGDGIDFNELAGIICLYGCSGCFFVEFCVDEIPPNNNKIKKELKLYLKTGDYSAIFCKHALNTALQK